MDGGQHPSQHSSSATRASSGGFSLGADLVTLHKQRERVPVLWEPDHLANHHVAVLGTSGAGKTTWIRRFITALPSDVQIDVFDYHGDIYTNAPDAAEVLYSRETRHGFNPLIINPDIHYGGVERAIREVLDAFNQTSTRLGIRQAELLHSLLVEVYAARGIREDDPASWQRRVGTARELAALHNGGDVEGLRAYFPTLSDVHEAARRRLFAQIGGIDDAGDGTAALDAFEVYRKAVGGFHRQARKMRGAEFNTDQAMEKATTTLVDQRKAAMAAFETYLCSLENGREVDEISAMANKDTLMALMSRLRALAATGLFEPNPPPFGRARIRRHNLRPLAQSPDELNMFLRLRLRAIIKQMMQAGHVDGRLRRMIILDEAKPFSGDEADNPINIIATQMRKFGLGLLLASQSIHHLSQDFTKNAATLLLLDADTQEWDAVSRSLRIPLNALKQLKHHEIAAVRMRTKTGQTQFRGLALR